MDGYWAAICGGIIPVPLALGITAEHRQKVLRVARKIGNAFLYTDNKSLERLETLAHESGEAELFAKLRTRSFLVGSISDISKAGKIHRARPEDLASIQFSSGSTSEPKGVMLTHHNIVSNAKAAQAVDKFNSSDVSLSWMPLTHDMGLIGFYFMQFANRVHINLMPTDLFVRRPVLWLQVASKKRATITCSPNFGYRHLLKVLGDRKLENVDLSSIRSIYNGAEPISVDLCNQFMKSLAYTGLKHNAMFPVYGLAEASLAVTFPEPGRDYRCDLENIAIRAPGLDLNKVVAAGVSKPGTQGEELVVFVLHRGGMQEFLPTAAAVSRLVNEHTGLEVAQVIPVKRIPKTTSGKVQRHLLEQAHVDGEFDAELADLAALRDAHGGTEQVRGTELENKLQSICENALPGKRIDVNDNLFEIGASSLKLIEIHENIDREFPGLIDLTELFDHPTIADLAKHLETKLKATPAAGSSVPA